MRLDWLKLRAFKNLDDLQIDFDEGELFTVLIGQNGTGKSNVIEALVTIFRDLDLGQTTVFPYAIAFQCHGHRVAVDSGYTTSALSITVDGKIVSRKVFDGRKSKYLPANVFGYYSGGSRRLEALFDAHQARYYREVIAPTSSADAVKDIDLRRLFYCRPSYGQLALLTYFAFGADSARAFLKKHLGIAAFDSALLVLRKPRWAGTKPSRYQQEHGDPRFWYAAGLVRSLLAELWKHSLAPITDERREQEDYRAAASREEQAYIFIRDEASLRAIAQSFGDEKTFFALLETLDISDLIREVRIWVEKPDAEGEIPFHEISDGEKQLLSVLGLMRFTGRDESLFLLDEPDTHLNPAWKWDYLSLIRDVAQRNAESHIIMTSHDPLTMGSLTASQVQVMAVGDDGRLTVSPPDVDPRGLGFTSILTQIFGLPTTVDRGTQELLEQRNALLRVEARTQEQETKLIELSSKLQQLGFLIEDREPEYALFLRAFEGLKREGRPTFTPEEIMAKNEVARRVLRQIISKQENSQ